MTLVELPWSREVERRFAKAAEAPELVDVYRDLYERGRVRVVANQTALAVYDVEMLREEKGANLHAFEGSRASHLLRAIVEAGRAQGVTYWNWRTRTQSRARLYGRWLRELAREGRIDSYMITRDAHDLWRGQFLTESLQCR
jgi:hypothetical protein